MTRLEALRELAEKVEAGEFPGGLDGPVRKIWPYNPREADDLGLIAAVAFDGSLDASKALHEAVLPEWHYTIFPDSADVQKVPRKGGFEYIITHSGDNDDPARAWLLAIIRALISQEESAND